jgi:hypothetical protein
VGDQEHRLVAEHVRRAQALVENVVGHLRIHDDGWRESK